MRRLASATSLVVLLTGCSGSPPDTAPLAAASPTPSPAAAPSTAPPTAVTTRPPVQPSATPSSPAEPPAALPTGGPSDPLVPKPGIESPAPLGAPVCRASDLTLVDADAVVTPEYVHEVFVLRTAGPDCQLEGFPQLWLQDGAGAPLPIEVVRGGFGLPVEQAEPYSLSRGTSLSFRVASPRGGSCRPVASVVATLPGTSAPLRADSFLTACGDTVGVSPLERDGGDH